MAGDSSVKKLKVDLCIIGAELACGCRAKEEGIKEVLIGVKGVSIARVDENLTSVAGTEKYIKCDTPLLFPKIK